METTSGTECVAWWFSRRSSGRTILALRGCTAAYSQPRRLLRFLIHMRYCSFVVAVLFCAWSADGLLPSPPIAEPDPGEVTIWSHLPPPPLMKDIGDATMKVTTRSPQAQSYFNQGLRLLHAFWYFEAYRAFKEAARLDPSAGMAYWGIAQTLMNFPGMEEQAKAAIEKAKLLMGQLSDHEQVYIRATATLIENPDDHGRDTYVSEMRALMKEHPDDLNAPAFLAFFVMSGYDPNGKPTPGEIYAETLLRRILASHPNNIAANHYWIHAVEGGPEPQRGLRSVELLLRAASNSGHLVHMAGHVYFCLGDYEKARKSFLDSLHVDEAYLAREHIPAQYDDNYEHNLSYMIAACAEGGRRQEALNWAEQLGGLPASPAYAGSALNYAIPVGSARVRIHLRFGDFAAAAHEGVSFGVDAGRVDTAAKEYEQGLRLYAHGMAILAEAPTRIEVSEARQDSEKLRALLSGLNWPESRAPAAMCGLASQMSGIKSFWVGGAAHLLEVSSAELRGVLQCAEGDNAGGFQLLRQAVKEEQALGYTEPPYYARPVEESLGYAYLRAHAWELARDAFQQELRLRPKSGFALFGIARSYELEGRAREATSAYEEFLAAWKKADRDLPQIQTAQAWIEKQTGAHQ